MIQQFIKEQQSHSIIGGFIAKSADPILAHVNPSRLQEKDLVVLIQADQSIIVSFTNSQDQSDWTPLSREQIHRSKSLLAPRTCYFKIKHGEYAGTYLISPDLIVNDQFKSEKDYLEFLTSTTNK
ncbi:MULTISPECIES: hypothetical protein [unclassified Exiguobacterium]|uniref:hypothetical protein n=1 Tax=unclassified Exiguobacterium TaxID=2644629 RepID=UPI0025C35025|nr:MULTISPECIES: hypothetical protein [unclassified Exiguobacterium]